MSLEPGRLELLELDVDTRLIALWCEMVSIAEWDLDTVAQCARSAYAIGYMDALLEPRRARGQLYRDHGYRVPDRQAAA